MTHFFSHFFAHFFLFCSKKFFVLLLGAILAIAMFTPSIAVFASEQADTTITLREPFPGQSDVIDVSGEEGSIGILSKYVSSVFKFVAALSVIIAILVTMAAGFKIMFAGGDSAARDEAKDWIQKTFMGLAFLFLAGLFLKTVNPNFYLL